MWCYYVDALGLPIELFWVDVREDFAMKKTLFLALTVFGFCTYDAQAGIIFKKKSKSCSSCNCTEAAAPATVSKTQNASAPSKKVEAPSPVKAQDAGKGGPAPAKAPKKVAAPAQ